MPLGNSPMRAEGCAPIGLKYLKEIAFKFISDIVVSFIIVSPICFVFPYGEVAGCRGVSSVTGSFSG